MEIAVREIEDVKVLEFSGNLDTNTAPQAQDTINNLLGKGATKILVNFTKLDYISSAGLRVLLATAKDLKGTEGTLRICGLNEEVNEVFEISGFSTILSVFHTEADALESI